MKDFIKIAIWLLGFFLIVGPKKAWAANENIPSGAFIINMGVTPQTINNGLKPYGLVYDLLKNHQVPVKWVINPSKQKDSADFIYNGIQYRGGTFIIPAAFRTAAVNAVITTWQTAGVVGVTTSADITVNVYLTLKFAPYWTLDKDKGSLVTSFFVNAGIPPSAHGGASSSGWKTPAQLGLCDDVFVLPHADPTWATHQNLYYWNQTYKGNIWSACHAVNMLENITNPGATIQMNFLSTTGLVPHGDHKDGSPPYNYNFPTDQVMQFMGTFDGATTNGSEQIFLPKLGGAWRTGSKLLVYDPTQQDVPVKSPGPAAVAIYGRAYNDSLRGFVMYEGGHDLNSGSIPERVAAQRAFFNYSFYSANDKAGFEIDISNIPDVVRHGDTLNIGYYLPVGYNPANYSTKWKNSCGGTFIPTDTLRFTKFRVPTNPGISSCVISVTLTDACGRQNFASKMIHVIPGILQNDWNNLSGSRDKNNINLQWFTDYENGLDHFVIERSANGVSFSAAGYLFAKGNTSIRTNYQFKDEQSSFRKYYYRVRAVNKQGQFELSNTILLQDKTENLKFTIAPNPVTSSSEIIFYSEKEKTVQLHCFDLTGKRLANQAAKINKGETRVHVSQLQKLVPGMYILKVEDDTASYIEKFIVRN